LFITRRVLSAIFGRIREIRLRREPSESPKEENKVDKCARNGENSGFLSSWFKPVSPKEWSRRGANGVDVAES